LTDTELADPSNGIWCCATHGREIDTNAGKGYSAETLLGWKIAREEAARRERTGHSTPGAGWISQVNILKSALYKPQTIVKVEKANLLLGGSIGKSALFEWLSAAGSGTVGERWSNDDFRLRVAYSSPLPHHLDFSFVGGRRNYIRDDGIIHLPPPDLALVHCAEDPFQRYQQLSDRSFVAASISATEADIEGLISEIERNGSGFITQLYFANPPTEVDNEEADEDGADDTRIEPELYLTVSYNGFDQSFASLSSSEKHRVLLEFAAALARAKARDAPTLLLLDAGGWPLSEGSWTAVAGFLVRQPFQTLMTCNLDNFDDPAWQSWNRIVLKRESGKTNLA
jgi:hypothetical protein